MGNGLFRNSRHRKGELPIPLFERRMGPSTPDPPSSLILEVPKLFEEKCMSEPPSPCGSLDSLDKEFRLKGINGSIGLSKDLLHVPGSLQEVSACIALLDCHVLVTQLLKGVIRKSVVVRLVLIEQRY